jgi:hypothetical protein
MSVRMAFVRGGVGMTENPLDLHVVGRTADGFLWHTIRRSTGSWTAFGDVLDVVNLSSLRGHVVDVACGRRAAIAAPGNVEGLYVLVAFENEPPRLLFRSSNDGSWSQQPGAFFPTSRKVAVGTFTSTPQGGGMGLNQIHMAAVTDDGHLLTALANATETQPVQLLDDVETMAGETGQLRAVALDSIVTAGSQSSVPLLAVTAKAELLWTRGHGATIADPSGTWTPWLEVVVGTAERRVPADAIDADFADGSVVAVTGDGHVWLAQAVTPGISGAWRIWEDLETTTTIFTGDWSGTITTITDVGTFNTVAAKQSGNGLHVVGTTTNGKLWHQLRMFPTESHFRDIELAGVGQDVGDFTAVDCG